MSSIEKSRTIITDLYKGLEVITQLLKDIKNSVKDDLATNNKIEEASETLTKISTQTTEILSSVRSFDISTLISKISGLERAQSHIKSSMSSLQEDTSSIKSMITEMYNAFRGQSSSAPSSSVTLTFYLTNTLANVKGENATHTATKEPLFHIEGHNPSQSSIMNLLYHKERAKDKEDEIKKAEEEAKLNSISKTEVIKVVCKEAEKLGIHPKEAITSKAGELFKKALDAEHDVLKRQHIKKVRKSLKLRNHKYDSYMWTVSSRLKPEPITDIKIHPKTKLVVIAVYRGGDGRNFDTHKPFLFGAFGISELDKLREIIPKKKNAMVKDLMNSLSQRCERLRQIPRELGIQSAPPAPKQSPSQTSERKRKHMKLEPETRIPGLECNQTLLENVMFVNNMVIEEPEYRIFFTDEFGDQAFQRWSDINKVGMEALLSYLVWSSLLKMQNSA
uniref:Uncharacterized protein n=1 Tax=Tanacetum cinerariifolium TaxID=118510 RepID=A0A699HGA0_TANCI|nr:hypothetical protein [Tanacetum cinerariifolium]